MRSITSTAPTRIDLAGGTIDLWPIHQLLSAAATVNVGITLDAQVKISPSSDKNFTIASVDQKLNISGSLETVTASNHALILPALLLKHVWSPELPAIKVELSAKSPAGAGLGGSSCLAIAILHGLYAAKKEIDGTAIPSEQQMVATAQDIEALIIKAPTGVQDYWGGVRGGLNLLRFPPGKVDVKTLDVSKFTKLEEHLIVCFSGQARASALNNWQIFKRVFDGDTQLIATFNEIGQLAMQCLKAAERHDFDEMLRCSHAEWQLRVKLWPDIETPVTKAIDAAAKQAGAVFTRVCGAGGGGVMAVFCDPSKRPQVLDALKRAGGQVLDAKVSALGMRVSYGQ